MFNLNLLESEIDHWLMDRKFRDLAEVRTHFTSLDLDGIEALFEFQEDQYKRILLITKKEYDLVLCCWNPKQESPFHGHPDQGCLVHILHGSTTEEIKYTDGTSEIKENNKGEICYITDKIGYHRVWNNSAKPAVSLHLYAPGGYQPVIMTS